MCSVMKGGVCNQLLLKKSEAGRHMVCFPLLNMFLGTNRKIREKNLPSQRINFAIMNVDEILLLLSLSFLSFPSLPALCKSPRQIIIQAKERVCVLQPSQGGLWVWARSRNSPHRQQVGCWGWARQLYRKPLCSQALRCPHGVLCRPQK